MPTQTDPIVIATFAFYIVLMLVIGLIAYFRTQNLSDYILGGRRLNSFVTALSAQASDMSGWLLLGLPGAAYSAGLGSIWIAIGLLIGTYFNWLIIARRLRERTALAGDALTISEYLENRFEDTSHALRWISGITILVFFLIYTTSGLVASGKLFDSVFNIPYRTAVIVGAVAIISYTCIGGFIAVCWTDCIQGLLMLAALVALPLAAIHGEGGLAAATDSIRSINPNLLNPFNTPEGGHIALIAILSGMGWGLGYFGQPHILCRFMAIRDAKEIPTARRIAMVWVLLCMTGAVLVGLAGIQLFQDPPLSETDTERVFILLVQAFLHPVPAGICLAAILAAIMSTADSQLLVSSSVLAEDFYKGFFGANASPRSLVWIGRGAVVGIALIASLLAMDPESMVLRMVAYAWAGFGAAFGPILIFSLFWEKTTRNAALVGIVTGGVTVIVWRNISGGLFELYEIIPGFLFSSIMIVLVTWVETHGPLSKPASVSGERTQNS
jgi:sodium/proline symporter